MFAAELLILSALVTGQAERAPDVAVVCPQRFRAALEPWLELRRRQGHVIELLPTSPDPEQIRASIRGIAEQGGLKSIVLVGDVADVGRPATDAESAERVPTHLTKAKVNVRWGSEPHIASDNWYADLDVDQAPDVAIGRLSADSAEQLTRIVAKIVAYETRPDFGAWRRQINLIAGVGGFGQLADAAIEATTKKLLTDGVPASYATTMTYASWQSPFCPSPREFAGATLARLNEGCLFWVYLGHGHTRSLDRMCVPGNQHRIFESDDIAKLDSVRGQPIALFMSCYAGAFDAPEDCLAEEMLRQPGGPVAAIAGSRVTMPYAMAVLGSGLLKECFATPNGESEGGSKDGPIANERELVAPRTVLLGEALQRAKRRLVAPQANDRNRAALDLLASLLSPAPQELAAERLEHVELFNLLGDPLLRIRSGGQVAVRTANAVRPGDRLEVTGLSPVAGHCVIELVVRRDRLTFKPTARERYNPSPQALAEQNGVYLRANDPRWATCEQPIELGEFHASLDVPKDARGPCHVRVFVEGAEQFALGSADVEIRQSK